MQNFASQTAELSRKYLGILSIIMKAVLLLLLLTSCTTQRLAQSTKHRQRVNQRGRDQHLHHDQKIKKQNFFNM